MKKSCMRLTGKAGFDWKAVRQAKRLMKENRFYNDWTWIYTNLQQ